MSSPRLSSFVRLATLSCKELACYGPLSLLPNTTTSPCLTISPLSTTLPFFTSSPLLTTLSLSTALTSASLSTPNCGLPL